MNDEEGKKEMLLNLARKIGQESFKNLRCLYINELPYSVKIDTPIQLFHYLDIENTIDLKLLLHNLKSVKLKLLTEELESYITETWSKKSSKISIGEFLSSLKEGLRLIDIRMINYLLGTKDSTDFSLILCDFLLYFGRHLINWTSLWTSVAKLDDNLYKSLILPELEKISKKWPVRHELKYKQSCLMLEISKNLSKRNIEELSFFYKMPMSYMSEKLNALELIVTLEKEKKLSLQEFSKYLNWIGWDKYEQRFKELINELDKSVATEKMNPKIAGNPLKLLYKNSPNGFIKELAKSQNITELITDFDNLLLTLIRLPEGKTIDLTPVKKYLVQIERFDLIKIGELVCGQRNAEILPEHRSLLPNDFVLFQLLEKLDPLTTRKLAQSYGLKDMSLMFSGQLIHYMSTHGMTDIDLLKRKLTEIGRKDLIECLDVPIRE